LGRKEKCDALLYAIDLYFICLDEIAVLKIEGETVYYLCNVPFDFDLCLKLPKFSKNIIKMYDLKDWFQKVVSKKLYQSFSSRKIQKLVVDLWTVIDCMGRLFLFRRHEIKCFIKEKRDAIRLEIGLFFLFLEEITCLIINGETCYFLSDISIDKQKSLNLTPWPVQVIELLKKKKFYLEFLRKTLYFSFDLEQFESMLLDLRSERTYLGSFFASRKDEIMKQINGIV